MQIIIFGLIAFLAILLNILSNQGYFNVADRFLWKQTINIISQKQPVKASIPSINVESGIERVGVDAAGKMQAPSTPKIISWYQFGALAGEKGNVVLSGHRDSTFGPGVFYTLENVKTGNPIIITDAKNNVFTYTITHVETVESQFLPVKEIFSDQKKEKLLYVVTCAGKFDFFKKSYDRRVLVKAQIQ